MRKCPRIRLGWATPARCISSMPGRRGGENSDYVSLPDPLQYLRHPKQNQTSFAFSSTRSTFHALVFESFREAWISTRSPALHSLPSSCAWYLFDLMTTLP